MKFNHFFSNSSLPNVSEHIIIPTSTIHYYEFNDSVSRDSIYIKK
jgi:hypothetical protein